MRIEAFDIEVKLSTDDLTLFVVPFEIHSTAPTIGYLLVRNKESLGSIFLGEDYRWTTREKLPWSSEDLQLIGNEIESLYFLFQD